MAKLQGGDEEQALLSAAGQRERPDWKQQQPSLPRFRRWFLCGRCCGCCPWYFLIIPVLGVLGYLFGLAGVAVLAVLAIVLSILLCCPFCTFLAYESVWDLWPWYWKCDAYTKLLYLTYQMGLVSWKTPTVDSLGMPADKIRPKAKLDKYDLFFALHSRVPRGYEDEYLPDSKNSLFHAIERNFAKLPMTDNFETFRDDEDPVDYVMGQVSNIFPVIYQDWQDKRSDEALTRFCLYGLGAHRIETATEGGSRYFVVRTNVLSGLPVREGFARYGGDAYFDQNWRVKKIVDAGLGPATDDGTEDLTTRRPGEPGWDEAKFRFRSSVLTLVTLVDHLYLTHLQSANVVVTAIREQLSSDHPVRRLLTPFTYSAIRVNDNAAHNLVEPRSLGPRVFAFTDRGFQMAFEAAPSLLMGGHEVGAADGGPLLNRERYTTYLKTKRGIDTEFNRQCAKYWAVVREFIEDYMACYYPTHADAVQDEELMAMVRQVGFQYSFAEPVKKLIRDAAAVVTGTEQSYNTVVDVICDFIFNVTAMHEQAGAIDPYAQDASFCSGKWVPGKLVGTYQTASAQGLLMSFASLPMPKLLGADWSHLFPDPSASPKEEPEPQAPQCFGSITQRSPVMPKKPVKALAEFQAALRQLSEEAEAYNKAAKSRSFPECFPLYVLDPRHMETSAAV
mmetsp:Transcript_99213/g.286248  ORF Transcript_99213/g.286248 Transcript_99213/m.286248 type:complete len:674 (+) Transcript_99213:82-2103(+)